MAPWGATFLFLLGVTSFIWIWHAAPSRLSFTTGHRETRIMMDTAVSVTVYGPAPRAKEAAEAAFQTFLAVDRMASYYASQSEAALFNSRKSCEPSASFSELLRLTTGAYRDSSGIFDPTFSPLYDAYGLYSGVGRLPTDDELRELLRQVGWERMVTFAGTTVLLASEARADFGGIAGGYAVEQAAQTLRQFGMPFFIDDGGDLWMEGEKPDGRPWRVAVRDPRPEKKFLAIVETKVPVAISTSGDYERFVEVDGRRIGHILDPISGRPPDSYMSVTVVASSPVLADIQSTVLFALPPEKARAWADANRIPALFLPATGTRQLWMSAAGSAWFRDLQP